MRKECLIIASGKNTTSVAACATLYKMGFVAGKPRDGFYPYHHSKGSSAPDVVVVDLAALAPEELSRKLCNLRRDYHLTLFCATEQDKYRVKRILKNNAPRYLIPIAKTEWLDRVQTSKAAF